MHRKRCWLILSGSGQVHITGGWEITMRVPANIDADIRFDCVRLSVLQRANSRSGRTVR
jgi:hypothetical protein